MLKTGNVVLMNTFCSMRFTLDSPSRYGPRFFSSSTGSSVAHSRRNPSRSRITFSISPYVFLPSTHTRVQTPDVLDILNRLTLYDALDTIDRTRAHPPHPVLRDFRLCARPPVRVPRLHLHFDLGVVDLSDYIHVRFLSFVSHSLSLFRLLLLLRADNKLSV